MEVKPYKGYFMNKFFIENPDLLKEWHKEKNKPLTLNETSIYSNKKVWWICKKGHEWEASISNRNKGSGCPYCSGRLATKENNLAVYRPDLIEEWDDEKNQITPYDVTPKSGRKVYWKCKEGHSWNSSVANKVNGKKCPTCNSLAFLNPELTEEWHDEKNGNLSRMASQYIYKICG
jgi:DNA-directed RNA polymerase subunit RPC12/RpoP